MWEAWFYFKVRFWYYWQIYGPLDIFDWLCYLLVAGMTLIAGVTVWQAAWAVWTWIY